MERGITPEREVQLRKEVVSKLPEGKIVFHHYEGPFDSFMGETNFDEGRRPPCTEGMPGIPEEQLCKCGKHVVVWITSPTHPRFDTNTGIELGDLYIVEKECQHRYGRTYSWRLGGKKLAQAIKTGILVDATGLVRDEIIQRAEGGRGHATLMAHKCQHCGKREILSGTLVSGGMEYQIEFGGIIGPAFFAS